jgi:hypothetical protein
MKEAKAKFDELVNSAKRGEIVNFGALEKTIAEGLMKQFLKDSHDNSREFLEDLFECEYEKRYGEEYEVCEDSLEENCINYRIAMARQMCALLGVKPSFIDLKNYVGLSESNYRKFSDQISYLSKDGKPKEVDLEEEDSSEILEENLEVLSEDAESPSESAEDLYESAYERLSQSRSKEAAFNGYRSIFEDTGLKMPESVTDKISEDLSRVFRSFDCPSSASQREALVGLGREIKEDLEFYKSISDGNFENVREAFIEAGTNLGHDLSQEWRED